jgi:beta-fructofuranosidase
MALRLPDKWLWDFWTVGDAGRYHLFYLQAPRSLGDPEQRHWNVSIGHAVSADLAIWEVQPDALTPGADGAWDDYTTWTGSVIKHDDRWAMLYTGTCRADEGLIQRVGLAWSDDLIRWTKDPNNPVFELDPERYEELDLAVWHDQAWRDPEVFFNPDDGRYHALLTARVKRGPSGARGVIARATSPDLRDWTVLDPVTSPGVFGHLEIPQLVEARGRWWLFFSAPGNSEPSPLIGADAMLTGTHYLSATDPTGPFEWESHGVLLADPAASWYGAKLVRTHDNDWVALAWRNVADDGGFAGTLSDPMAIEWDDAPRLRHDVTDMGTSQQ